MGESDESMEYGSWVYPLYGSSDYNDFVRHDFNFTSDVYGTTAGPSITWSAPPLGFEWGTPAYSREEDDIEVSVKETTDRLDDHTRFSVSTDDVNDLEQGRVLKCISIMKSKLMMKCMPVHVKNIECRMTPSTKENIINAYRKLEMYGKKLPFVASYDEYGRQLPDEIRIDTMKGMEIKIVDPEVYGNLYLELRGIVQDYPF